MQLIFLNGADPNHDKLLLHPSWPANQAEDVIVRYPMLAYKSQLATNNEIVFVNVVENAP
jgi:hypothetical protein